MSQIIEIDSSNFQVIALTKKGIWLPIFIHPIDENMLSLYHWPLLVKVENYDYDLGQRTQSIGSTKLWSDEQPCQATDPKKLERQILSNNVSKNEREWWAKRRIEDLMDFCVWMTGCGYDFPQHEYFCKKRDELLKRKGSDLD
jgi:hypothetical protein